jgi:phage protein U
MIGSLGKVVFVATPKTIRTFADFTRSTAGRWANHEVIGKKAVKQFIGPGLDTVTFTMHFDAKYGINPRKEMTALQQLAALGKAMPLTIGGQAMGSQLWVVTQLSQSWDVVDKDGNVVSGNVDITLEEYLAVIKK